MSEENEGFEPACLRVLHSKASPPVPRALLETDNRLRGFARGASSFDRGAAVRNPRHRWWPQYLAWLSCKTRRGLMVFFLVRTTLMMDGFRSQAARDGQGLRTHDEIDHHLLRRFLPMI